MGTKPIYYVIFFWVIVCAAAAIVFIIFALKLLTQPPFTTKMVFASLSICSITLYLGLYNFYRLRIGYCTISLQKDGVRIHQPLRFIDRYYLWEDLKGFSLSKIDFGRPIWESRRIIIYCSDSTVFEILESYNYNYVEVLEGLKTSKLEYFGTEPMTSGVFRRKFQYK